MLKKVFLATFLISSLSISYAQEKPKSDSKSAKETLQEQLEQMRRQMERMFAENLDSSKFQFPPIDFDTTYSRAFRFFNDGNGWKQWLPDSNQTAPLFRELEGFGNFFKTDENLPKMLEQMEGWWGGKKTDIPSIPPRQKGDLPNQSPKNYKTDSL